MSSTASAPPQVVLDEVRKVLDERRPAEETIRTIRCLLEPPAILPPVQLTDRGWPVLRSAWERCDEPKMP